MYNFLFGALAGIRNLIFFVFGGSFFSYHRFFCTFLLSERLHFVCRTLRGIHSAKLTFAIDKYMIFDRYECKAAEPTIAVLTRFVITPRAHTTARLNLGTWETDGTV